MTRQSEDIAYPDEARSLAARKKADQNSRVALVNSLSGGVLLSIHQNNYTAPQPNGPQVFYAPSLGSRDFAERIQSNLSACLAPQNRRLASPAGGDIYLMKKAENTAVLVECGFLSNPTELQKLESDSYRLQLSAVLLASWLQYTNDILT